MSGFISLIARSLRLVTPVKTRALVTPCFEPIAISVSSLSPTKTRSFL